MNTLTTEGRLLSAAVLAAFASLLPQPAVSAETAAQPNILFINSDDQSYETVRAFGHSDIDTPHFDRLAASGTTFPHAYNMGAWHEAVCVASRSMLLTENTLWRANALENRMNGEREGAPLAAAHGHSGLRDLLHRQMALKDRCGALLRPQYNIRIGTPKPEPEGHNRPSTGQIDPWRPSDPVFGGFWDGGKYWSEALGDDSISFLEKVAKSEKPFFMYLAFNGLRDPRQSPHEYLDRYPLDRVMAPESFLPEYPYSESIGSGRTLHGERLAPFPCDENTVKVNWQECYAIITHMDTLVGCILDALEALIKADDTWIKFTSDHGLAAGLHGLMGKQNIYDHSL